MSYSRAKASWLPEGATVRACWACGNRFLSAHPVQAKLLLGSSQTHPASSCDPCQHMRTCLHAHTHMHAHIGVPNQGDAIAPHLGHSFGAQSC